MKCRNGFVTNSSSSSFIIAIKDGTTKDQVKEVFHKFEDKIMDAISWSDEFTSVGMVIDDIVDNIFENFKWQNMELGDWKVTSKEYSSEDGVLSDCAMYDMGYLIQSDFIKVG